MRRKTSLIATCMLLALTVALTLGLAGCGSGSAGTSEGSASGTSAEETPAANGSAAPAEWEVTLLDGYPEDVVPLYESTLIDTSYYSVRNDPQWAAIEGGLRNFYHVVYHTDVPIADVLAHYKGLMTNVDDSASDNEIEGTIGQYTVWVNATEEGSYNCIYLRVDLPKAEVTQTNPFFAEYPSDLVETPECFAFFEEIYYQTLYTSTDMSYTRHFDVADLDGDGTVDLDAEGCYAYFAERYGDREEFTINRDAGMITWLDGEYEVTVAFMSGYDRGVLVIGWDYQP